MPASHENKKLKPKKKLNSVPILSDESVAIFQRLQAKLRRLRDNKLLLRIASANKKIFHCRLNRKKLAFSILQAQQNDAAKAAKNI